MRQGRLVEWQGKAMRVGAGCLTLKGSRASIEWMLHHPIGRIRPFRTVLRYLCWQVRSRMMRGPHVVLFANATRLLVDRHEHGTTANIYVGLREFESMSFVMHGLRPGDLFVDVGAHVGTFTVLAAAVAGANVVAVEPVPSTARRLEANLRLNSCEDAVELRTVAVGAASSRLRITADKGPENRILLPTSQQGHSTTVVDVLQLDDIVGGAP